MRMQRPRPAHTCMHRQLGRHDLPGFLAMAALRGASSSPAGPGSDPGTDMAARPAPQEVLGGSSIIINCPRGRLAKAFLALNLGLRAWAHMLPCSYLVTAAVCCHAMIVRLHCAVSVDPGVLVSAPYTVKEHETQRLNRWSCCSAQQQPRSFADTCVCALHGQRTRDSAPGPM